MVLVFIVVGICGGGVIDSSVWVFICLEVLFLWGV